MFYIISLKHTHPDDAYMTLWGPYNIGLCHATEIAGVYPMPKKGYHDSDENFPVSIKTVTNLLVESEMNGRGWKKHFIPNTKETWKALGFELKGRRLYRKNIKTCKP
jgi:hypothetical protein